MAQAKNGTILPKSSLSFPELLRVYAQTHEQIQFNLTREQALKIADHLEGRVLHRDAIPA